MSEFEKGRDEVDYGGGSDPCRQYAIAIETRGRARPSPSCPHRPHHPPRRQDKSEAEKNDVYDRAGL